MNTKRSGWTLSLLSIVIWTPLIFCLFGLLTATPPDFEDSEMMVNLLNESDAGRLKEILKILSSSPSSSSSIDPTETGIDESQGSEDEAADDPSSKQLRGSFERIIRRLKNSSKRLPLRPSRKFNPIYGGGMFMEKMRWKGMRV